MIVAPGFGKRGMEGKFIALRYTREHGIPTMGICLGMQAMAIEFARNVLGYKDAHSTEMEPDTPHNIIDMMESQKGNSHLGGSMRLGAYPCTLRNDSRVAQIYGTQNISERHRHRYEFNHQYQKEFEVHGMHCVGINPDTDLVEIIELEGHPWYIGTQFHPEYSSTVLHPHPLFISFVQAAEKTKREN